MVHKSESSPVRADSAIFLLRVMLVCRRTHGNTTTQPWPCRWGYSRAGSFFQRYPQPGDSLMHRFRNLKPFVLCTALLSIPACVTEKPSITPDRAESAVTRAAQPVVTLSVPDDIALDDSARRDADEARVEHGRHRPHARARRRGDQPDRHRVPRPRRRGRRRHAGAHHRAHEDRVAHPGAGERPRDEQLGRGPRGAPTAAARARWSAPHIVTAAHCVRNFAMRRWSGSTAYAGRSGSSAFRASAGYNPDRRSR